MHWTRRVSLLCLSLTVLAFAKQGQAQQTLFDNSGTVILDDFSGAMTLSNDGGTYLLFQKWVGDGVGFNDGFSRIGLRAKVVDWEDSHLYAELHSLITDNGRFGFNVGTGYRWLVNDGVLGVHSWYDNYESYNKFRYEQIAFGVEYLHPGFDVRANGYVPFGDRSNFLGIVDPGTQLVTYGHSLGTVGTGLYEQALNGWDLEAGVPVPYLNWVRAYAGGYFLNFQHDETTGFKARIEGRIASGVTLSAVTTNDDKFGTNVNLNVEVRLDGRGAPTSFGQDYSALSRRYDQVWRDWSMHLGNATRDINVALNNPATGNPYNLYWINNTNAPGGDGTFENPNSQLPSSNADADIFLVKAGAGNTTGNIQLSNGQRLFGEGIPHLINTDRLGMIQVPNFATSGSTPTLAAANPNAPVVILGSNSEVSGFDILGGSAGIAGTNINNFLIRNVNVTAGTPLQISNATGIAGILDSTFTSTGAGPAMSIVNTTPVPLSLAINNVTTSGGSTGLRVNGTGADINLDVDNLTGSNHSLAGINIKGSLSDINASFTNTNMSNLVGSGVVLELDDTTGTADFEGLTATGNGGDGFQANASDSSSYTINIVNSDLRNNTGNNVSIDVLNQSLVNVLIDPTTASGAGNDNLKFQVIDQSTLNASILDTDLTGATRDAVNGFVDNGSTLNLAMHRSSGAGAGRDGLNLRVTDGSNATVVVDNVSQETMPTQPAASFAGSGRTAVSTQVSNGSSLSLSLTDVPGNSNGTSGFDFNIGGGALGKSTFTANVTNGTFSDNSVSNIIGRVSGSSEATLNFNNVTADDSSSTGGLNLQAQTGGSIVGVWTGGSISNTQGNGVQALADGVGSGITMTFNGVAINDNMGDGVNAALQNGGAGSKLAMTFNSRVGSNNTVIPTSISGNQGDGVDFTTSGAGATGALQFGGAQVTGNTGDGVRFNVTGGATMTGTETPGATNEFSGNGGRAMRGIVSGAGSSANVSIADAVISSNSNDALVFDVNNGGAFTFGLSDSTISSLSGDGLKANVTGASTATFNLSNVLANNNAGSGYVFDGSNNSIVNVNFTGAMQATGNARNGIQFNMNSGADITFGIVGGDLSNNGTSGAFSGLNGTVDGAGSSAVISFIDTVANGNSLDGFELDASNGGLLTATFASTTDGAMSASGNTGSGIKVTGTNANQANLIILGNGSYNNNGVAANTGHGVEFDVNGASQAVVKASGQFNANGIDGIRVAMANATTGAVDITGDPNGTLTGISDNVGHGVNVSLTNSNLSQLAVNLGVDLNGDMMNDVATAQAFRVLGADISRNGGDGIRVDAINSDATSALIANNIIEENNNGILMNLNSGSDWSLVIGGNRTGISSNIGNNQININRNNGIEINSDSGTSSVTILNNDIVSNATDNIVVNLTGSSVVQLNINGNEVMGDGRVGGFRVERNFTGRLHNGFPTPPDTQGAVGNNHIVEVLNTGYRVYNKNTGAVLQDLSLSAFFQQAGVFPQGFAGDPRVLFDPQSNRWFVIAFDVIQTAGGLIPTNSLHIAVSRTDNPLDGFRAVSISGDLYQVSWADYPTLGLDADALYIGTNNFGSGVQQTFTTSLFIIPKSDLLLPVPTALNIARFEGLPSGLAPGGSIGQPFIQQTPQGVVDLYRPADGVGTFIGSSITGGSSFTRIDVLGAGSVGPSLSNTQTIVTPPYTPPPGGQQPGVPAFAQLDAIDGRITSNIMRIGDSLWMVHGVQSSTGRSAARWYEVDANTNQVLQTGTIQDPNFDFLVPSIAANAQGGVVIGFTMTGQTLNPSSAYVAGKTVNGVTTFGTPTVTRQGTGVQDPIFFASRWGDYSATVLDPTDSNRFWTFQEFVDSGTFPAIAGFPTVGIQMTEIFFDERSTITGTTTGNGISLNLNGNAQLAAGSTINNNTISGNTLDGLRINAAGNSNVAGLTMTGTTVSNNGDQGIDIHLTTTNTARNVINIGQLGAARNTITGNSNQNIRFETTAPDISQLQTAANPDVLVLTGQNNPAPGAYVDLASRNLVSATFNVLNSTITNSANSDGVELVVGSSTLVNSQIAGNTFSGNAGFDLNIRPVVSNDGTQANPPSSINNAAPNTDVLVYDPVAHLDLALGSALVNADSIPDATPLATVRNTGETMSISFLGDNFTNADPFKTDRQVRLAGQVQIQGTLNTNNTFTTIPSVSAIFAPQAGTFNIVPATIFPDTTVP